MSFWTWLTGAGTAGVTPNANPPPSSVGPSFNPGDPNGLVFEGEIVQSRALPKLAVSPWSGWPAEWATPDFISGVQALTDTAWTCIDLNSSVLGSLPISRFRDNVLKPALPWMQNPNPAVYSSWNEFAKQLFWQYQAMGEVFVLDLSGGNRSSFVVVPGHLVKLVGRAEFTIGDDPTVVTRDEMLHVRYSVDPGSRRGHGPLEVAGARLAAAGLLQELATRIASNGGVPGYWLTTPAGVRVSPEQAQVMLQSWVDSRTSNFGSPALLVNGTDAKTLPFSSKEIALLELSQWTESRIAVALGVPPFLVGLPSGGDSLTYSSVSMLFDYHDRASLRPKARSVMAALSSWALPPGESVRINSDEYTRPAPGERAEYYTKLAGIGAIGVGEVRVAEGLHDDSSMPLPTRVGGVGE